ncbi:hypothetical protein Tco_0008999 [Tanacetum coccineum]
MIPNHDIYLDNQITDQSVQEIQYSEQPVFNNDSDIDISNDSNMISYDHYLKETKTAVVQDTSSSAQQDELIMPVIEDMANQVAKCNEVHKENKIIHESLTAEFERYKEQIKLFEERQKFDLNDREKFIDNLNYVRAKEDKFLDDIIALEKKNKALDNVVYKWHETLFVIDTEETLEKAEESRLKMLAKQNDPTTKEKKVNIAPIDYVALNKFIVHVYQHHLRLPDTLSVLYRFWTRQNLLGADEEIFDGGVPRVIVLGYDGLPMQPVAPPSPDYIPGPKDPQTPLVPQDEDEREPMFVQAHDPDYLPKAYIPCAESPGALDMRPGESSTARTHHRPGIDYGFVSIVDVEERRQGIRDVGYSITDTWIDLAEAEPEVAPMTVGEVNTRVTELAKLHECDTHDLYALTEDAQIVRSLV